MSENFAKILDQMHEQIAVAPEIVRPSSFWIEMNKRHTKAIFSKGVENFKRTLARDYFMWTRVLPWDSQIRFLIKNLPITATLRAAMGVIVPFRHRGIPLFEGFALNFLTRLIWQFVERQAPDEIELLMEPAAGNPPDIRINGRKISQDLANSILEYKSIEKISENLSVICEIGGGYGRTAFVLSSLIMNVKYIMVDIPPALGVAQTYLREIFPDRRHFAFRPFSDFSEVKAEFDLADFVFLTPDQLQKLPDSIIDLFINISSLHEMRHDQIRYFIDEIFRLVRPEGYFYLKAWKVSNNPIEGIVVLESDYPLDDWNAVYRRTPLVQSRFFETLLQKPAVDRA